MFATAWSRGLDRRPGRAAIGVDVGGTKVALGVLDAEALELSACVRIPSSGGGEGLLERVRDEAARLATGAAGAGREVVGVGLGMPEIVSLEGRITSSAVIDGWDCLPVDALLGEVAPLRIESDVRAAAFAEAVLGEGRRFEYFLYFIVGTGISYCAVLEGRPLAGAHGGALNVGSSTFELTGAAEAPVLERIASGSALVEHYMLHGGDAERAEDVLAAAARGEPRAVTVVEAGATALGIAVALLVNLLDPQALIFGGGLGSSRSGYVERVMERARPHMYSDTARRIPALASTLASDGGVIGAALVGLLRR